MIYKTLHKELRMLQHEIRKQSVSNSFSISGTRRVISEEWTVPSLLVAPVVLFLKSGAFLLC